MFDALAKLSASIPDAYNRASEFKDLHLGDLHLLRVNGKLLALPLLLVHNIILFNELQSVYTKSVNTTLVNQHQSVLYKNLLIIA